ncbi:MAG: AmmeMemoRadiSam system protein B [Smithellaceae bacterium]|nr:AmmeMemoRadiSam system protein B [Smithellaceae bacterium]
MESIRKSVIAGSWYPGDPATLKTDIAGYFRNVPDRDIAGEIVGLIAPHAGYLYSGQVAAHAYKLICKKTYDAVILVGPSHRVAFRGVSIFGRGAYKTPLGLVSVDEKLASELQSQSGMIVDYPAAHAQEHSLEIQLPFLQVALGSFVFVPLIMGDQDAGTCRELAGAISRIASTRRLLVVASSDLSHFHADREAKAIDGIALGHLQNEDPLGLLESLAAGTAEACGGGPMVVAMLTAQALSARRAALLKYANSGDVTGDRKSVVGYAAAVYYR